MTSPKLQQAPAAGHREATADWRGQAACRTEDPELFFPISSIGSQTSKAKAICGRCPAQTECLNWASRTGQVYGIWGGLDEKERSTINRRKK